MIFTTAPFFIFFPIVFFIYWGMGRVLEGSQCHRARKLFLLAASYFFYGFWDEWFLLLILASSVTDYVVALKLEASENPRTRKLLLWLSLLVNLGILGYFKYFNFFIESAVDFASLIGVEMSYERLSILLPVGISFYTFQTLSYTIEVYQRKLPATRSVVDFFLFVAFFPQLVAGPIVRAREFLPQLLKDKRLSAPLFFSGAERFMIGAFKKLALGDASVALVDPVFADPSLYSSGEILMAMVAFCIQVYGDFSGYSDMATGTARMLGFELPVNFKLPFISLSVTDFWRRWHVTMGAWFRDYVYIPMGGNQLGTVRTYFNLIVTFVITGLWHGAAWPFVVYGLWNGIALAGERIWRFRKAARGLNPPDAHRFIPLPLAFALTTVSTVMSFGIFRCPDLANCVEVFSRLFGGFEGRGLYFERLFYCQLAIAIIYHVLAGYACHDRLRARLRTPAQRVFWRALVYALFIGLMLAFAPFGSKGFLYFQF